LPLNQVEFQTAGTVTFYLKNPNDPKPDPPEATCTLRNT